MRFTLPRALAIAALSPFLVAQDPAAELTRLKKEANAAVQAKDYETAAAIFKKVTAADPKDGQAWQLLGYSLHAAGKLDEALPAHTKAAEFPRFAGIATYNIACVHALKGNADEAFACLEKCVAGGYADVDQLDGDSDFDGIRKDPRYAKIAAAMKAKAAVPPAPYEQCVERKNARLAWFTRKGAPQIAIDWSPVPWRAELGEQLAAGKFTGQRWRLGADFWTRIDSSLDLKFGEVVVPAGYWYLTLEQRNADTIVLAFHDPAAVRKAKVDAFMAGKLTGGIEVVMKHTTGGKVADELTITLAMGETDKAAGQLGIRFGDHSLAAPFTVKFD
ncbi:MAG: tetratricopeptide repeat protein [Planctomycetota bacterium]